MVLEVIEDRLKKSFWTEKRLSELEEKLELVLTNKISAIRLAEEIINIR